MEHVSVAVHSMRKADELRVGRNRDPLDTLSAIWILASNDENPEISYAGLRHRLRLDGAVDEERRLVAEHGELFRLTIPEARLAELKDNTVLERACQLGCEKCRREPSETKSSHDSPVMTSSGVSFVLS